MKKRIFMAVILVVLMVLLMAALPMEDRGYRSGPDNFGYPPPATEVPTVTPPTPLPPEEDENSPQEEGVRKPLPVNDDPPCEPVVCEGGWCRCE